MLDSDWIAVEIVEETVVDLLDFADLEDFGDDLYLDFDLETGKMFDRDFYDYSDVPELGDLNSLKYFVLQSENLLVHFEFLIFLGSLSVC